MGDAFFVCFWFPFFTLPTNFSHGNLMGEGVSVWTMFRSKGPQQGHPFASGSM